MGGKVYSWGNGNGTPSPIMEGIDLLACSAYHTVGAGTIHEERECVCGYSIRKDGQTDIHLLPT